MFATQQKKLNNSVAAPPEMALCPNIKVYHTTKGAQ
jgi:hypothetical protein